MPRLPPVTRRTLSRFESIARTITCSSRIAREGLATRARDCSSEEARVALSHTRHSRDQLVCRMARGEFTLATAHSRRHGRLVPSMHGAGRHASCRRSRPSRMKPQAGQSQGRACSRRDLNGKRGEWGGRGRETRGWSAFADHDDREGESGAAARPPLPQRRATISFLISAMALAGFRLFGQVRVQFMMVWQR